MCSERRRVAPRLIRLGGAALLAGAVGLVAACGPPGGAGAAAPTTGPDSADCSGGASTTSGLQPAMRQLTDNLAALGPAAERNDLSEVRSRLDSARGSAAQISGGLAGAATTMSQGSLIRTQFQAAADAGGVLRDTLDDLNGKLGGAQPPDEEAGARLQQSVTEFNAAVERVSLACSNHFSAAVVEPTTSVPPTRTTR